MLPTTNIRDVRSRLANARSVTVLTGAGISADSGVPTFRGQDGLWRNFRAEALATPEAFEHDPRLVWEWYDWRRGLVATKAPNPAHVAVARMEEMFERFWLLTQNVDGLHRAAGSKRLSEIHGSLWRTRCTRCGRVAENHDVPIAILPACSECDALVRPAVVWFGEALAAEDLTQCRDALSACDVLLVIGTSGAVYPAASFAALAKSAGAFVVEINVDLAPPKSGFDAALVGRAKDIVPQLLPE